MTSHEITRYPAPLWELLAGLRRAKSAGSWGRRRFGFFKEQLKVISMVSMLDPSSRDRKFESISLQRRVGRTCRTFRPIFPLRKSGEAGLEGDMGLPPRFRSDPRRADAP